MQHDYLEDAKKGQPVDAAKALTDQQLEEGGLAPVKAWVRTKQSKNAARVQRHKEKQATAGVKQLNLQAPAELHDTLRRIAAEAREGRDWRTAAMPEEASRVLQVMERGGWRARLLRWLSRH